MISYEDFCDMSKSYVETYEKPSIFKIEWITGGMFGGSCWENSYLRPVESEEEPAFEYYNSFLTDLLLAGHLNKLTYEIARCIPYTSGDYCYNSDDMLSYNTGDEYIDFYGNYEDTMSKTINVKLLYDHMIENDILC